MEAPFILMQRNNEVAEIFKRTISLSDRRQFTFYKETGGKHMEKMKNIPTLSHLGMVIDNYHEEFSQGRRSDIVNKISQMYVIFFNIRARF